MSHTAVVILNYNGEKLLRQFLPTVIKFSGQAEVIVADNGSTDQSLKILEQEFPQVRVIKLEKNYGFCGGYNRALQHVSADYYVLLNSDVEVTPDWLTPLIRLLDTTPSVAAAQPKVLSFHQRNKFEYAGAGGGFIDSLGYPFCRGRIFQQIEEDLGQYNDTIPIFWATGACMMVRAETYRQEGGLDEDFFAHMEEIDLCWKIHRTGMSVFYCGQSTVYHVGAGTLGYGSATKTYLNFRNGLTLLLKHLDPGELLYKIPMRMVLDWVAAFNFLFHGQGKNFVAVIRAHIGFIGTVPRDWKKRILIRRANPTYNRSTIFSGLILWRYLKR